MKTFNKIILATDKKIKDDEILTVELFIDDRIKSRIIATTKDGQEVGILTARGTTLRDGTLLSNDDSEYLKVVAALENVSTVRASTPIELTALAYHLGNRHVPLQIDESGFLRYQTDHVLDDMVVKLGGALVHEQAKFEPVSGAYSHHHHDHEHDHDHEHEHHHEHEHDHDHEHHHEH